MPEYYYKEALHLGQREAHSCEARGISPLLPALDDMLPAQQAAAGIGLGIQQVPAEFIVGTKSAGRSQSFARNFMPLMDVGTEFSDKWEKLAQSHVAEGIRDAVQVYEYLNRYYVAEGNKRVSVLKFFDAATVTAEVRRILPERNGDEDMELYYELVDFQRVSGIRVIEFSRRGSCAAFQSVTGKGPDDPWTDDQRLQFYSLWYYFRKAYQALGGGKLTTTVGDALLVCARLYGYQSLCNRSDAALRVLLGQAWEEILLLQQPQPVEVKLRPAEEKKPSLLTRVFPLQSAKPCHVAFIHNKTARDSGWTYGHELGRAYVERVFGQRIVTSAFYTEGANPEPVIQSAIDRGNTVLFTTSPLFLQASVRCAAKHPEVTVFNCSLNQAHRYIRSYHARMYEAKFIIGAMAGALAGNNAVGYIADYPVFGQIAGINAFAFGVEMVNPRARVHLEWSGTDSVEAATARLAEQGVVLISSQDQANLRSQGSSFGLSVVSDETRTLLAAPVWEWGVYYEKILRGIFDRSSQEEYEESPRALNYYWGMSEGVVSLRCSDKLPEGVRRLERILRKSVCSGLCDPFRGALYDQGGRQMIPAHASLSPEQIIGMDWLGQNVVGGIPDYDALTDAAKANVDLVGILRGGI